MRFLKSAVAALLLAVAIPMAASFATPGSVMDNVGQVVTPVVHAQWYGYQLCADIQAQIYDLEAQGWGFNLTGYSQVGTFFGWWRIMRISFDLFDPSGAGPYPSYVDCLETS